MKKGWSDERLGWGAALLLSLPAVFSPLYNPDLFWHLSAGRWILEQRALPRADFLSFSMAGQPWHDFEWLAQLGYQIIYSAAGMTGLWLFKITLIAACAGVLLKILSLHKLPGFYLAAALALWSAGVLPYSDIRPELFSLLFFLVLFYFLERQRLMGAKPGGKEALGAFLLFAAWSNLHSGFIMGLGLAAVYGAWWAIAAGIAGSLCNPYGLGPHLAAWEHWAAGKALSRNIKEWHPLSFENPVYWPLWLTLLLSGGAIVFAFLGNKKKVLPWSLILAVLGLGAGLLTHKRLAPYFNAAAVVAIAAAALPWTKQGFLKKFVWAGLGAYALFLIWLTPRIPWTTAFSYQYVCRQAADFLEREKDFVRNLKLYNEWEWGGYLGWRLSPWYKVSQDGRYIFHGELEQAARAGAESGLWRRFMEQKGFDGAILPNIKRHFPSQRLYPDGSYKSIPRPWYLYYMPREQWALVYWDEQALFFVKRGAAAADWLAAREYRYLLPRDEAARADAMSRKEIPEDKLAAERRRHEQELRRSL